jgi:hypothetical protein
MMVPNHRRVNNLAERAVVPLIGRAPPATRDSQFRHSLGRRGGESMWTVLWATLVAGALDVTAQIILRLGLNGMAPSKVLQSVASGVLGKRAFGGDLGTAALGLLLHFSIMAVIATVFYEASRRMPMLDGPWLWRGLAYGLAVYLVMSFVVVPLSAFPGKVVPNAWAFFEGALVHMLCVGVPIAFICARSASG